MNILLCMPKVSYPQNVWPMMQIGIAYVSSSLKTHMPQNVYTLNLNNSERSTHEALSDMIHRNNISIVGCGDLVVNYREILSIIDSAKKIKPSVKTFIGGGFVTYSPVEAMKLIPSADFGIIGEGEVTAFELVDAICTNSDVSKVDGIIYRGNDGELITSNPRTEIADLDTIPFPDYKGFFGDEITKSGICSIVTSRSCPYSCTYCSQSGGKKYRQRSIENIFEEIDFLVKNYGMKTLLLSDELFAVNPERIEEFCRRIKSYNLKWKMYLRLSDSLTVDLLRTMKGAGCYLIYFGLESADDRVLTSMNKKTSVGLMERVLSRVKEAGLLTQGTFIFGDTEETEDTVNTTMEWAKNNRRLLDQVDWAPIILYPGSPLYSAAVSSGRIDPMDHIRNLCPPVNVSKLSDEFYHTLVYTTLPAKQMEFNDGNNTKLQIEFNGTVDIENYSASIICPACLYEIDIAIKKDILSTVFGYEFSCTACSHSRNLQLVPHYTSWIDGKLRGILENNRCAVWPVSYHFMLAYGYSYALSDKGLDYLLIDSAADSNKFFMDRQVFLPDVLNEKRDIDTVIVFSRYFEAISREISLKFPCIKPTLFHEIGAED